MTENNGSRTVVPVFLKARCGHGIYNSVWDSHALQAYMYLGDVVQRVTVSRKHPQNITKISALLIWGEDVLHGPEEAHEHLSPEEPATKFVDSLHGTQEATLPWAGKS